MNNPHDRLLFWNGNVVHLMNVREVKDICFKIKEETNLIKNFLLYLKEELKSEFYTNV